MQQYVLIRMELKYCERCGGLLLRPLESARIYCGPCGRRMAELPLRPLRKKMSAPAHAPGMERPAEVLPC